MSEELYLVEMATIIAACNIELDQLEIIIKDAEENISRVLSALGDRTEI